MDKSRLNAPSSYGLLVRLIFSIIKCVSFYLCASTDSLPGEYYSYLTPQNKIILSNETSLSYSFYYIAVSSNDTLDVVSYPSSHNSTAISVTYNGLPSEVLDKLSVTLALERDSGVINGSEVTANITIIGMYACIITVLIGFSFRSTCHSTDHSQWSDQCDSWRECHLQLYS